MRLVDLDDYADFVFTAEDLLKKQCIRKGRNYVDGKGEDYVPLYESKLIHQYDPRYATFENCSNEDIAKGYPRETSIVEHQNPEFEITPRFWVPKSLHNSLLKKYRFDRKWLFVYRDVTGSTNQHTTIATIIPPFPATRSLPALGLERTDAVLYLLANMNSIILDYLSRVKVSGMHLSFNVLTQLPLISPDAYDGVADRFKARIRNDVLDLLFNCSSLKDLSNEFGYTSPPAQWNDETRMEMICELNAIYLHLYGLSEDETNHVLDSFRALETSETTIYGEFRTRRLTMEYFKKYMSQIEPIRARPLITLEEAGKSGIGTLV